MIKKRIFLVIPTYNEAENIGKLVEQVIARFPYLHIIAVDDNSPDGTGRLLEKLKTKFSQLQIIHRRAKLGLGTAYAEGFRQALAQKADFIVTMDADFSHRPQELEKLLEESRNADVVIGSRYVAGGGVKKWESHRLFLSRIANAFVRIYLRLPVRDATSGFRVYSSRFLKTLDLNKLLATGYAFQTEMINFAARSAFTIRELPIVFHGRELGKTKIGGLEVLTSMGHVLIMPFMKINYLKPNQK